MAHDSMAANDLLEECRLAPDDDEPRLVWADAVGGERGELVVIQCGLSRGGLVPAEAAALRRRERALLAEHGARWAGLDELRARGEKRRIAEFRRGFVDEIELDAYTFVEDGEEILRRAPLLRAVLVDELCIEVSSSASRLGDPLEPLRRLLAVPALTQVQDLYLGSIGFAYEYAFEGRGDEAARLLVESDALAHLTGFGLRGSELTDAGLHLLVESGLLGNLDQLWLDGYLSSDAILAALDRAPRLTGLGLATASFEAVAAELPPVTRLQVSGRPVTGEALAALGRSHAAATLELLDLSNCVLGRDARLPVLPRLRVLALDSMEPNDPVGLAHDIAGTLPSLRRLRFQWNAGTIFWQQTRSKALLRMAQALGPQLEELDVGIFTEDRDVIDELQPYVAGEVGQWHAAEARAALL